MVSLSEQLSLYDSYHQHKINKWAHMVGVPMIVLGVMVFFSWIRVNFFSYIDLALSWLVIFGVLIYYYRLGRRVAGVMSLVFVIPNLLLNWVVGGAPSKASFVFFVIFFMGGWVLQFVGHFFEKQKPAFLTSIVQLLIGPIYIVNEIGLRFGVTLFAHDRPGGAGRLRE